jgi:hypothetical protein
MKNTAQFIAFAAGNEGFYEEARDYFAHDRAVKTDRKDIAFDNTVSFSEKEKSLNAKLIKEIERKSNVSIGDMTVAQMATHPTVAWATFAIAGALVDMILPETLIETIGLYTEIHNIGIGDSASIVIKPRDLFVITKAGMGKRQAELKKQFNGQVNIVPENHMVSVYVDLYRVLAGLESLADFMAKCVKSIETKVALEVFDAFDAAMVALPTTTDAALRVAGYTSDALVGLGQKVSAYNGGAGAVFVGTKLALSKILPTNSNYRYALDSDYVKLGYIRDFMGFSVIELPQVADWENPFLLALDDTHIYVLSPSANKLIHLALGGDTLSFVSGQYDNANLLQTGTLYKKWGIAVATNAIAGIITLP